nr:cation transporting ATPase C-terminal domain-containing protein [Duganella vulcania]
MGFNALVYGQLLHALNCRSDAPAGQPPPHPALTAAVGASGLLQLGANLAPGLRRMLGLAPLGFGDVLAVAAGAVVPYCWHAARRRR